MEVQKMMFLSKQVILRFHVDFPGCIFKNLIPTGKIMVFPVTAGSVIPSDGLYRKGIPQQKELFFSHLRIHWAGIFTYMNWLNFW